MANTHEHLEHAEHGAHSGDPFDKRVALTMAIVAACLAAIGSVGHAAHNTVLRQQGDANRLRTEAAAAEVEKSNLFAWYQSKRNRQSQFETTAALVKLQPAGPGTVAWTADPARAKAVEDWEKQAKGYNAPNSDHDSLPELRQRGDEAGKRAADLHAEAKKVRDDAEHVHHQAARLDIAHLGAELGLVFCSIALMTKRRGFWYAGILAAVAAVGITASAYMIPHDAHAAAPKAGHADPH